MPFWKSINVSKRSRRQKDSGVPAQDAEQRVFSMPMGNWRKDEQDEEVLRFVDFWK